MAPILHHHAAEVLLKPLHLLYKNSPLVRLVAVVHHVSTVSAVEGQWSRQSLEDDDG